MNAMCLGTQQRQIAEGDRGHGFHPFIMAPLHCHARLRGRSLVFIGATWLRVCFLCSTGTLLIATVRRGCLSSVIAFVARARPPPDGHREESV
jgi:hypothetical protein